MKEKLSYKSSCVYVLWIEKLISKTLIHIFFFIIRVYSCSIFMKFISIFCFCCRKKFSCVVQVDLLMPLFFLLLLLLLLVDAIAFENGTWLTTFLAYADPLWEWPPFIEKFCCYSLLNLNLAPQMHFSLLTLLTPFRSIVASILGRQSVCCGKLKLA